MPGKMETAKVAFKDFSGGDYGRDWAGSDTQNMFRAVNVIPYPGGWIGPRQPLVEFTLPVVEGQRTLPETCLWFVENEILLMSDGSAWNVKTGECNDDPTDPDKTNVLVYRDFSVSHKQNGEMFCISSDMGTQVSTVIGLRNGGLSDTRPHFFDRPTSTGTDMPDGLRLGNHEDTDVLAAWRQFFWAENNQATVWDPVDFNITGRVIYDLVDQKNTLVILVGARDSNSVSSGLDTETRFSFVPGVQVFVVYGTLGAGATFRRVDTGPAPAATDTGAFIWNVGGDDVYWFNDRWLMKFDGAEVTVEEAPLPRLLHDTDNYNYGPDAVVNFWCQSNGRSQGEFILSGSLGDNGGDATATPDTTTRRGVFNWIHGRTAKVGIENPFISRNSQFSVTSHDPGIEFRAQPATGDSGEFDGAALSQRGDGNFYVWRRGENAMVFVTQGSESEAEGPKFYEMALLPSFPTVAENDGDTGAPVTADFHTADYWDEQGREIYVEGVMVEYAYHPNEGQATNQTMTFEIETLQNYNEAQPRSGGQVTFTPPAGSSSEPGTEIVRGRAFIPVRSSGSGDGFRIHVSDWQGIAIKQMIATVKFTGPR